MDAQELVTQYLEYAANEVSRTGRPRTANTMTTFRRALEGFVKAVNDSGLPLSQLPENFLEKHWLPTQGTALNQPIQLRVRAGAVKAFLNWAYVLGAPIAPIKPLQLPNLPKPPKKELSMSDVTSLGDAFTADPVPSTTTYAPQQPSNVQYLQPQQVQSVQALPPQVLAPQQRAPAQPKAPSSSRPNNPLAAMLPTGQFKLRVRREREMDDPVWVGDFPADRVAAAGAIEPFLGREVTPRLLAQGITGDVTFLVCSVSPEGREGERIRMTVAATPPVQAVQQVAAPVLGAPVAQSMQPNEMADMLAYHRRAQEELEERIAKKIDAQKPTPTVAPEKPAAATSEMDALKQMVAQLAGSVQTLSAKLEAQQSAPQVVMPQQLGGFDMGPPQQQVPQLDILSVIKEVAAMSKPMTPAQPPMGLAEVFSVMAQAKQMFQPQNVNIDVSPLEEEIRELKTQMANQAKKKDEISDMVEKMRAMKELFSLVGGEQGASKPTGLSSALGSLVEKLVNDPEPIAAAAERVLSAAASLKAAQNGAPMPPQPTPYQPQARPQPQDAVPPPVRSAMEAMLNAQSDGAVVVAAHEWLTVMMQVPQLQKVSEKMMGLLREERENELAIYMRQVFATLGYTERATPDKVKSMVDAILAQVREANNESDEGDEEEGGDEALNAAPDMNIRVGGVQSEDEVAYATEQREEEEKPKRKRRSRKKKEEEAVEAQGDEEGDGTPTAEELAAVLEMPDIESVTVES